MSAGRREDGEMTRRQTRIMKLGLVVLAGVAMLLLVSFFSLPSPQQEFVIPHQVDSRCPCTVKMTLRENHQAEHPVSFLSLVNWRTLPKAEGPKSRALDYEDYFAAQGKLFQVSGPITNHIPHSSALNYILSHGIVKTKNDVIIVGRATDLVTAVLLARRQPEKVKGMILILPEANTSPDEVLGDSEFAQFDMPFPKMPVLLFWVKTFEPPPTLGHGAVMQQKELCARLFPTAMLRKEVELPAVREDGQSSPMDAFPDVNLSGEIQMHITEWLDVHFPQISDGGSAGTSSAHSNHR